MKFLTFDYRETCLITHDEIIVAAQKLREEIERVARARTLLYETEYAAINLPYDAELIEHVKIVAQKKQTLNPTVMVVIGIGGSNLGTMAVHEAVKGKLYNETANMKVYYADTVDADYISEIKQHVEFELTKGNNVLLNVISKSGTTTETVANFELFLDLLKKARPHDYQQYVVVTTDEGSALWNYAVDNAMTCFAIPNAVGGRYSVLSAVGLFPLCMLGIDIDALCEGARTVTDVCIAHDVEKNVAALSAIILYEQYKKGVTIHDTFLFSVSCEGIGKWYRQLTGESIGKAYDRDGKRVNVGITPTVSIGSVDLHSVAQLYLGGPYDKYTTFISFEKNDTDLAISHRSFSNIMDAILKGTKIAYHADKRPFSSFILPEKSEFYIGQLLQIKMIEMMYLGYLLDVNPFDQPQVELYKKETRKILAEQ
jgi:glucose-6-phosphate isomerase